MRGLLLACAWAGLALPATTMAGSTLRDPADGWLDLGEFLDTAYGFVPIVSPITEPAVGYGAAGAAVFVDRHEPGPGGAYVRPDIAAAGGMATQNGSQGLFAAHLGTWAEGRVRTQLGVADLDLNLEFYGLGGGRYPGNEPLDYSVSARGGLGGASWRWGDSPVWIGARYLLANTTVRFHGDFPEAALADRDLRLGGLTPSLTVDRRDNFFTPTKGWYLDLSVPLYRDYFGSDREFETATLTAIWYQPLREDLFLALRGTARTSGDGTPFFLRPYVVLRGVQALSYQGEQAADAEAELRWQFHPRFSLVAFAGGGLAHDSTGDDRQDTVAAGGAGIRYLVARRHGLHLGLDLAFGPDDPVIYVVFGSAWLRP